MIMADGKQIEIKQAKGRPMLTWVGKQPLRHVTAYPAQHIESYTAGDLQATPQTWQDWPEGYPKGGLLFHGDNKEVLAHLLANGFRGKVDLIYIDPPFDSGANYVRKVSLRGIEGIAKLEGEEYSLGEQVQYTDIWANENYLQFMYERLLLLKELLRGNGTIYLHCDQRRVHHLRCLLDEVFGPDNFINEIIWQHQIMGSAHDLRFPKAHETILWYTKGEVIKIRSENPNVRVPYGEYVRNSMKQDENGKWYYERRRMSRKATPVEATTKAHTRTIVEDPDAGTLVTDVWTDMLSYQEKSNSRQGLELYPTQKTTELLSRLISAATDPSDIVMDCFIGSGTTAVVSQLLGRRWIGCDINKGAIQNTSKRIQVVIEDQLEKPKLVEIEGFGPPSSYSFSIYRVNDYDLQIQHNEAVELACQHVGIQRTRSDAFFDGTHGKKLAKVIPFNHPCTLLDLEEIKRELQARPEEERDITVVALGKETAVDAWLEDWNRLRRRGDVPNKIELIELRSDPRYGKFFVHQPATARVHIQRLEGKISVEIQDFISPSIIERLKEQAGILSPQIDDWRSMVDTVMIDPAYNGDVFNIAFADVPEKKDEFVTGKYALESPGGQTTVAVKITDMLGEEIIVTETV